MQAKVSYHFDVGDDVVRIDREFSISTYLIATKLGAIFFCDCFQVTAILQRMQRRE